MMMKSIHTNMPRFHRRNYCDITMYLVSGLNRNPSVLLFLLYYLFFISFTATLSAEQIDSNSA